MTQFKDKIQNLKTHNNTEMAPTGIFMYPILMAADIILYDAKLVIVGSDQKQHIELTRDIVQRMNKKYNLNISVPEPYIPKIGARIMDLLCPTIKMSKSNKNENGTIFLLDKIDIVKQKIMKAKTDLLNHVHFDPLNQPGISNLMSIYSCLSNMSYEEIEKIHDKKSYAIFKQNLAELLTQFLKSFQKKYECVDLNKIKKTLKENAKHCSRIANANLDIIKQAVGLKND
jgi:tryptophanyl-tRNA synthetase